MMPSLEYVRKSGPGPQVSKICIAVFLISLNFSVRVSRWSEPVSSADGPEYFGQVFLQIGGIFSVQISVHRNCPAYLSNYFGHLK